MIKLLKLLVAIAITAVALFAGPLLAQNDYKHPYLNSSGEVLDSVGTKLGWITSEGIVYNAKGEKVAAIKEQEVHDYKGHLVGKIGSNGTFYNSTGAMVFTIETDSKGEKCKVFDPHGKVIATVHEGYKNQACAIHCLSKKMPRH